MANSNIMADILYILFDGKMHSANEIANEIEVHRNTVQKYVLSLARQYPISVVRGGIDRGGIILDKKYIVQGKIISNEKLQILAKALNLLQKLDSQDINKKALMELIKDFAPPTNYKREDQII